MEAGNDPKGELQVAEAVIEMMTPVKIVKGKKGEAEAAGAGL
jgi:hypothetical protein